MAHALRTRFCGDIVSEFLPPKDLSSKEVLILCDGMPSLPHKKALMSFISKRNMWVFHPRYRGAWESGGEFLKESPHLDILDIISELYTKKSVTDLRHGNVFSIDIERLYVVGGSFGGPAALFSSLDSRVTKVIARSSVVDWTAPSEKEPMDELKLMVRNSFGEAYRFSDKNWDRLSRGEIYNPVNHIEEFDGSKIHMIHAKDDAVVSYDPVASFANMIGATLKTYNTGGHLSSGILMKFLESRRMLKFLRSK
ncbi:MAG: hypothetical protein HN726_03560 [Candidatus Magasanikbacteria bacterium]|jgi:hypothetical protein|nr:hypothetical protein [Candidatus Magasanikbacteria bacterium]MBT4221366.1 hypothetical protein [Candidatus Magasanikbacteria bacterium]MBT4350786.1 hypothetical protein [Candidatus Magasanikbacteria bacterium]MBT4541538.1 hypothetical protein [Candidatus Magasanikbacteria bacterium]MBT6253490.1 hypothetical protein [Candidatus Magasanikbacteria bacterium]